MVSGNKDQPRSPDRTIRSRLWALVALPLLPAAASVYPWVVGNSAVPGPRLPLLATALLASGLAFILVRRISKRMGAVAGTPERPQTSAELAGESLSEPEDSTQCRHGECGALRRALAERERLLADLTHEIRTPVAAVLGHVELMRESGLRAEHGNHAGIIERASRQILALIDEALPRARPAVTDAAAVKAEQAGVIEPRTLLDDALAILTAQARKSGLQLEGRVDDAVPARLQGDPLHFRQVLLNLIANAIRFTAEGRVSVSLSLRAGVDQSSGELEVRVSDTGIGIEPEALARIFDRFRQADESISRRFGGSGLGLAIVAQLVESWGGKLGVDSVPGEGSTFWFTHPLRVPEEEAARDMDRKPVTRPLVRAPARPRAASPGLRGLRVLVAEDNTFGRELLTHILGNAGASVTPTSNAAAMLRHARAQDYELAILDFRLPDMRGDEAARRLRRISRRHFPIIILSADPGTAGQDADHASAVDVWLSKPMSADRLLAVIRELIAQEGGAAPPSPCFGPTVPPPLREPLKAQLLELRRRIAAAAGDGVDGDLTDLTHELRGIAGYFGLQDLEQATADLERLCRRSSAPGAVSRALLALIAHIEAVAVTETPDRATEDQAATLQ